MCIAVRPKILFWQDRNQLVCNLLRKQRCTLLNWDLTMIKKIIAFAAAALFSLNASAGYIQYNLHAGQNGLDGFIVQHDTDQSIAFFSFNLSDSVGGYGQQFYPFDSEGAVLLTSASNAFPDGGPTNFTIDDDFGGDHQTYLSVVFSQGADGLFTYSASYMADLYVDVPPRLLSGTVSGMVTIGELDPDLALALDEQGGYWNGVPHIVPTAVGPDLPGEVPEPASLALLALGAAGLAGVRRRNSAR